MDIHNYGTARIYHDVQPIPISCIKVAFMAVLNYKYKLMGLANTLIISHVNYIGKYSLRFSSH